MPPPESNPFETGLDPTPANHAALTPLSFLARAEAVWPQRIAVIDGPVRRTWQQMAERCRRLASALRRRGIGPGDTVSVMAPNVAALLEASFGVPMAGAVLNAMNIRLDSGTIAYMLRHSGSRAVLFDAEFAPVIRRALAELPEPPPLLAEIGGAEGGEALPYEALLADGDPAEPGLLPDDEWQAIALNYTSGTTGQPKGVVYHHRGAWLNAIGNIVAWAMPHHPVYLWTLPMFHCNGWCFPWTVTALGGTHVCLRRVEAGAIFDAIAAHGVTHLCGAPVVMSMLLNAPAERRRTLPHRVEVMTAAAPPPAPVIEGMERLGFRITHVYGLTEVYGPAVVCAWDQAWDTLPPGERARLKARQGVAYPVLDGLMVGDPRTLAPVPQDGETLGEVFMRGNIVMKGYLKDREATAKAFAGGWFHTGDLAVMHPDGFIELKDRSKDIIITGGENVSTIEVEGVLHRHPDIADAAVVARPDAFWGETVCAFVTPRPGRAPTAEAVIAFCREHLAHFKVPRTVVFGELPRTSTGKVQKYLLRERAGGLPEADG